MNTPITGLPGVGNARTAVPRDIVAGNVQYVQYIPGLRVIDGAHSRDALNATGTTTDYDVLRAGMLLGKITSSGKYAPSVIGVLTAAAGSGATSLTVAAAVASEIVRRIGTSGTLKLTGPPTAGGTVATQTITFSAVNTTTGAITCSATSAAAVIGSLVQPTDGSEAIVSLLANRWGVKVTDQAGNNTDVMEDQFLLDAFVKTGNIVNYPGDVSLAAWVKAALRVNCPGMTFDDVF